MMWWPVVIIPTMAPAGVAAVFSRRAAKTVLPLASAVVVVNGMQGTFLHWRGIMQKPGGRTNLRYNIEMGPPMFAPLLGLDGRRHGNLGLVATPGRRSGERTGLWSQAPSDTARSRRATRDGSVISTYWVRSSRWDLVTAGVVLARLDTDPQLSFFDADRGADGPGPARPVAGPARRAEGAGDRAHRRAAVGRADRWVALRRHARGRRGLAPEPGRAR